MNRFQAHKEIHQTQETLCRLDQGEPCWLMQVLDSIRERGEKIMLKALEQVARQDYTDQIVSDGEHLATIARAAIKEAKRGA